MYSPQKSPNLPVKKIPVHIKVELSKLSKREISLVISSASASR